jgi:hypothetical protein
MVETKSNVTAGGPARLLSVRLSLQSSWLRNAPYRSTLEKRTGDKPLLSCVRGIYSTRWKLTSWNHRCPERGPRLLLAGFV